MLYLKDKNSAPIEISLLSKDGAASPSWCSTDKKGNAYVSLTDNISAIKINYDTDIVSQIYVPPFQNMELFDPDFYPKKGKNIVTINGKKILKTIKNSNKNIITIKQYDQYFGFVGENTILPSCIDTDELDNVYVAYTHPLSNFICKYKNNGEVSNIIYFNTFEVPQDMRITSNNDIWVGIENINDKGRNNKERNDMVYFIDGETYEKTIIRDIAGLSMMTIDASQNLYVLNDSNVCKSVVGYKFKLRAMI
jgi:hypothetical protein